MSTLGIYLIYSINHLIHTRANKIHTLQSVGVQDMHMPYKSEKEHLDWQSPLPK